MKRTALLLLTVIYLVSCVGVAVTSFYCCGKLLSTTISDGTLQLKDSKMAMDMSGCCKTKKQYFKVKDNHVASAAVQFDAKFFPALNLPYWAGIFFLNDDRSQFLSFNIHAPPNFRETPAYILNCTYRI